MTQAHTHARSSSPTIKEPELFLGFSSRMAVQGGWLGEKGCAQVLYMEMWWDERFLCIKTVISWTAI
jgi:hypothetical protein